ncbi:transposase [Streptomyces phaeoluteigriseus]
MPIEPLLPPWPQKSPGPLPVVDRLRLEGILYVLHNDIHGNFAPAELGSARLTCWRRLEWWRQQAGVFEQHDHPLRSGTPRPHAYRTSTRWRAK